MAGTAKEPQQVTSEAAATDEPVTVTALKRRRTWYWTLSDGTKDPIGHPTKKAALAAGAYCLEVRAMNAQEEARRATSRAFVHPDCERVALDQLAPGDRAWIVVGTGGASGEQYPTRWRDVIIDQIRVLIPGESVMLYFRDLDQAPGTSPEFLLYVYNFITFGANRAVQNTGHKEAGA